LTINAITELVKYDDFRHKMLDSNVIATLSAMLGDWDEDIRQSTNNAIIELEKHDDSYQKLLEFMQSHHLLL